LDCHDLRGSKEEIGFEDFLFEFVFCFRAPTFELECFEFFCVAFVFCFQVSTQANFIVVVFFKIIIIILN
jgi:hypothetical protein